MAKILIIAVFVVEHVTDSLIFLIVIVKEAQFVFVGKVKLDGMVMLVFIVCLVTVIVNVISFAFRIR